MVKSTEKIFFVMPALNEEKRIAKTVTNLKKAGYSNIIVVDDGSTDKTGVEAKKAGAIVVTHKKNLGQGAGLRSGTEYALKHGADIIVHFDSDGQHRIEDLPAMLKPVLEGKADVTLGTRFKHKQGLKYVVFPKRVALVIAKLYNRIIFGIKLSDAHNGFRVLNRKAASKIKITCNRMDHATEIPYRIFKEKLRVVEVPVVIKYFPGGGHNTNPLRWAETAIHLFKFRISLMKKN